LKGSRERYDCLVVGLGIMGSACLYELAKRGFSALGLDRFSPPHDRGSSHGFSRIIRASYFEHPAYVPLVLRSLELWRRLEGEARRPLLREVPCLCLGPEGGRLVSGALSSLSSHGLRHERLMGREVTERYPFILPPDGYSAALEPSAGILAPEACVEAHLEAAARRGAKVHIWERVLGWKADDGIFRVLTEKAQYRASSIILCAGPWTPGLLRDLGLPLSCERQVMFWFATDRRVTSLRLDDIPIIIAETQAGLFYAVPEAERGLVKVARHHGGARCDPDRISRRVDEADLEPVLRFLRDYIPVLAGDPSGAKVCIYTNTPDEHFVIDRHPAHRAAVIVSACSGHGFKFAPVIAELASELVEDRTRECPIPLFRLSRFMSRGSF
jgi:sarcosine oxidase